MSASSVDGEGSEAAVSLFDKLPKFPQAFVFYWLRRSLSQSPGDSFFKLGVVENSRFAVWEFDPICHSFRDINISGFGGHISISGYRSVSQSLDDTSVELAIIDNPGFTFGISTLFLIILVQVYIFPVFRAIQLFPVAVAVEITYRHFFWAPYGRKSKNCRWNFNGISNSFIDISISGLKHLAIFINMRVKFRQFQNNLK